MKKPYNMSINELNSFLGTWGGMIITGGTLEKSAKFYFPTNGFQRIFGSYPVVNGYYRAVKGMDSICEHVQVINFIQRNR